MQNENSCLTHIFTVAGSSIGELPHGSYATLFSLPIAIKFGCKHRSSNCTKFTESIKAAAGSAPQRRRRCFESVTRNLPGINSS